MATLFLTVQNIVARTAFMISTLAKISMLPSHLKNNMIGFGVFSSQIQIGTFQLFRISLNLKCFVRTYGVRHPINYIVYKFPIARPRCYQHERLDFDLKKEIKISCDFILKTFWYVHCRKAFSCTSFPNQ